MMWTIDDTGTRWVEPKEKKRRNSSRNLRFKDLKVGDQIVQKPKENWHRGIPIYSVVTDIWLDPVEGQNDELKGTFVAYSQIKDDGSLGRKSKIAIRGLASQGFEYAEIDYLSLAKARSEVLAANGQVVSIGYGKVIRSRPKMPGHGL